MCGYKCETVELGVYGLEKDHVLPKEKLKSLTERLLQLSGMDSIVKQSLLRQEGPRTS